MEEYPEILKKASEMYFPIIASIAVFIAFWGQFKVWAIPLGIGIFVLCFFVKHVELIRPKYIEDQKKIIEVLSHHLDNTNKSLYYFGGAGFCGASEIWEGSFANKLEDDNVKVVRLIDLKKPDELKPLLSKMYGEEVDDQINDYQKWIKTHAKYLKEENEEENGGMNNFFYNYEGAPIWKHGMNYIVFDKKILAIITPGIKVKRKVVIIRSSKIAEEFTESIDSVVAQFKLKSLDRKYLKRYCYDKTE